MPSIVSVFSPGVSSTQEYRVFAQRVLVLVPEWRLDEYERVCFLMYIGYAALNGFAISQTNCLAWFVKDSTTMSFD